MGKAVSKRRVVGHDRLTAIGRLVTRGIPVTEANINAEYGPEAAKRHGEWLAAHGIGRRLPGLTEAENEAAE